LSDGIVVAEAAQRKGAARLKEIALLLGQPEDIFSDQEAGPNECRDAVELLQLWGGMKSAADRQKLLNFARTLAAGRK
jgi:hypothetical protein